MEKKGRIQTMKVYHLWVLLLALLQVSTPTSALNTTSRPSPVEYLTRPANVTVAVGEPAVFLCGVPETSPNITLTLYSNHGNYSLTCPQGHMEDIPQALYGSCEVKKGQSLAVWTIKGTSFSDNGTRVECQQLQNPDKRVAHLRVYDNGTNHAIVIGCVIGGFFGMLLVVVLVYITLQRSETFQNCFRGKVAEGDMATIVTKD